MQQTAGASVNAISTCPQHKSSGWLPPTSQMGQKRRSTIMSETPMPVNFPGRKLSSRVFHTLKPMKFLLRGDSEGDISEAYYISKKVLNYVIQVNFLKCKTGNH